MEQKEMMEKLQKNPAAIHRLMQSKDGQTLMQLLNGTDGGASLQKAVTQAAMGNTAQITQMLQRVMQSPEGAELIGRINQSLQK